MEERRTRDMLKRLAALFFFSPPLPERVNITPLSRRIILARASLTAATAGRFSLLPDLDLI